MIERLRRFLREPEEIGPPDCPILYRWTLAEWGRRAPARGRDGTKRNLTGPKLMVHRFLPNADDRDVHDHPRPFWTLVLRGSYDDLVPCLNCVDGIVPDEDIPRRCGMCRASARAVGVPGLLLGDQMRPGMLRFRPARHRHRTRVSSRGCWTIVLMGPLEREWGFWRGGRWFEWREYERLFGFGMRCED